MKLMFAGRLLLTLLAAVGVAPMLIPSFFVTLPFGVETRAGIGYIVHKEPGLPLAPGLQAGDVLAFD